MTGACMARQMHAAAAQGCDFFSVEGVATAAQAELLVRVLEENKVRKVAGTRVDSRGFTLEDASTAVGFDIPAVLFCEAPVCQAEFDECVRVAAQASRVAAISAPTQVDQADVDRLYAILGSGTALLGASEAAGEVAVLSSLSI